MAPIRAQLVGATGYGGLGILELLLGHPDFEVAQLVARDDAGKRIADIYPHLESRCDLVVQAPDDVRVGEDCDVVDGKQSRNDSCDAHAGQLDRATYVRQKRYVRRVRSGRDPDHRLTWGKARWVDDVPNTIDVCLGNRVEINRVEAGRIDRSDSRR